MTNPVVPRKPRRFIAGLSKALGIALLILLAGAAWVQIASERRLHRDFALDVDLPRADPALRAEGRHLAVSRGCADCHGDDFGGRVIADEMPFARLVGANLTNTTPALQQGGSHARMYLALHHGVGPDSRPLLMMPSKEFSALSAREIEALSAYFDSLAPVTRQVPDSTLGPLGRVFLVAGKLEGFLSAEAIDHDTPAVAAPPPIGTIEYGRHASQLCTGCHGGDFSGGPMPHGKPGMRPAANLTPGARDLSNWTERDFIAAMRTGRRPDGSQIDGQAMPWRAIGKASDLELRSIWMFLRSLPPVESKGGNGN